MAITDMIPFKRPGRRQRNVPTTRSRDPFDRLNDAMNRLFDGFLPATWPGRDWANWPTEGNGNFVPKVDVNETEDQVRVTAELPGVEPKDLDVKLDGGLLTVRGEKRQEKTTKESGWTRTERSYGSFTRSVPIGKPVKADAVEANFKDGVLTVTLPKERSSEPESGRIKVRAG